jgi:MFS family permease
MKAYLSLLSDYRFLAFWGGFTISAMGDAMTRVALTWYVLEKTGSSEALGLLAFCSTAPVVVGGLVAGWALDRFDRRTLLILDSVFRGTVVASVPMAQELGVLTLPHIYIVALVHGFLMMIPLAGVPSILPSIVPAERLGTANALEILSYTMSGMIGAPLAGILVVHIGAPGVLWVDAASYLAFALLLTTVQLGRRVAPKSGAATTSAGYGAALKLILAQPILLATTLMYLVFNLGGGALLVWLPLWAAAMPDGGAEIYGQLLGAMALGQLMSAIAAGFLPATAPQGRLICLALLAAGIAVVPFALSPPLALLFAAMALYGAAYAPLTILAQTLRMKLIPPDLRGRSFALLRMLMQSGNPVGGLMAGLLVPLAGLPATILATACLAIAPAMAGALVAPLRRARASAL